MKVLKTALSFLEINIIAFISLVKYGFVSPPSAGKQTFVPRLLEKRYIADKYVQIHQYWSRHMGDPSEDYSCVVFQT
jgi:hypothetical protein